jgi:glycosyltransferase involved in cell wall biosynthesis
VTGSGPARSVPTVVQVGAALEVRGGISSVERLLVESLGRRTGVEHVATMDDGNQLGRVWLYLRAIRRLRVLLRDGRPTVFHVHFASRGSTLRKYVIARMVLRTPHPLVLHAHGSAFDDFYRGLPRAFRRSLSSTFSDAHAFIALSTQWQSFYCTELGLPPSRMTVLVNPTKLPAQVPERSRHHHVQFLFMGRIGRRKGAFDLLAAYQALPPAVRARSRIVFAGDGRVDELRELAHAAGPDVTVHSWLDAGQRDALLADSDVLVLPSRQEGVPMAILEAMSYGLPVIATPVGGIPDVITDCKEGLLVDVGDRPALTAAMAKLVADRGLRDQLGANARATAEQLDISHYTDRLVRVYGAALDRARRT